MNKLESKASDIRVYFCLLAGLKPVEISNKLGLPYQLTWKKAKRLRRKFAISLNDIASF